MSYPSYCERLRRRQRIWWGERAPGDRESWRARLHRELEWRTLRHRDDPDAAWRCCEHWQRSLINKWNGREFAAKHGLELPALYWCRYPFRSLPIEALPEKFVLRAVQGHGRNRVHVVTSGRDLLRDEAVAPRDLRRKVRWSGGAAWTIAVLAEEFIDAPNGDACLPTEIKCHAFGGTVVATQVIHRWAGEARTMRFYSPLWEPLAERVVANVVEAAPEPPPAFLDEMVRASERVAAAAGTYLRVDFFVTERGPLFNEFSSVPGGGRGYTEFGDDFLGAAWAKHVPDAV
jgi:hypothetical protein